MIFIATLVVFLVAFFALSVGMIFGDIRIKGHCGSPSLDGGCCDSEPVQPVESNGDCVRKTCLVDAMGNPVLPCNSCNCDN